MRVMFESFWNNKKHFLNIIAVLTTIGAIFLTIPSNELSITAGVYLSRIQYFWSLVIMSCLVVFIFNFSIFIINFEKNFKSRDYLGVSIFIMISFYLLYNFAMYIHEVYGAQFTETKMVLFIFIQLFILSGCAYVGYVIESFRYRFLNKIVIDFTSSFVAAIFGWFLLFNRDVHSSTFIISLLTALFFSVLILRRKINNLIYKN